MQYLCAIFARSGAKVGVDRTMARAERSALATISSEDGIAICKGCSQLRNRTERKPAAIRSRVGAKSWVLVEPNFQEIFRLGRLVYKYMALGLTYHWSYP